MQTIATGQFVATKCDYEESARAIELEFIH